MYMFEFGILINYVCASYSQKNVCVCVLYRHEMCMFVFDILIKKCMFAFDILINCVCLCLMFFSSCLAWIGPALTRVGFPL